MIFEVIKILGDVFLQLFILFKETIRKKALCVMFLFIFHFHTICYTFITTWLYISTRITLLSSFITLIYWSSWMLILWLKMTPQFQWELESSVPVNYNLNSPFSKVLSFAHSNFTYPVVKRLRIYVLYFDL